MKAYLPAFTKDWLTTNPTEGEKLVVAAIAFFANHWGVKVYQEWDTHDIKTLNFTNNDHQVTKALHKLEDDGIIEIMRGLDGVVSMRLSEIGLGKIKTIYGSTCIPVELSSHGSILWSYFLGRTANLLEQSYSEDLMAPLEVLKKRYQVKAKPKQAQERTRKNKAKPKDQQTSHVIPNVYREQYANITRQK